MTVTAPIDAVDTPLGPIVLVGAAFAIAAMAVVAVVVFRVRGR